MTANKNILNKTKADRDAILNDNRCYGSGLYFDYKAAEGYLLNSKYVYYVTADRSDDNGAGRARYYYTNVETKHIGRLINIPETGRQRYGVAHDRIPLNRRFYVVSYTDPWDIDLFPTGSDNPDGKMTLGFRLHPNQH